MTPQEITDTKTIAKFMEVKNLTEFNAEVHLNDYKSRFSFNERGKINYVDELKYHTSWDWLMPVWVKFRDIKNEKIEDNEASIGLYYVMRRDNIATEMVYSTIEKAFTTLSNAIKWYNEIVK